MPKGLLKQTPLHTKVMNITTTTISSASLMPDSMLSTLQARSWRVGSVRFLLSFWKQRRVRRRGGWGSWTTFQSLCQVVINVFKYYFILVNAFLKYLQSIFTLRTSDIHTQNYIPNQVWFQNYLQVWVFPLFSLGPLAQPGQVWPGVTQACARVPILCSAFWTSLATKIVPPKSPAGC